MQNYLDKLMKKNLQYDTMIVSSRGDYNPTRSLVNEEEINIRTRKV